MLVAVSITHQKMFSYQHKLDKIEYLTLQGSTCLGKNDAIHKCTWVGSLSFSVSKGAESEAAFT